MHAQNLPRNPSIIELSNTNASITVAPSAGGRLMRWTVDSHDILHWPESADWREPAAIRGGNPLLFPFVGRHRVDGCLGQWRDAGGVVRKMPTHGFARNAMFSHTLDDDSTLCLTLADNAETRDAYPFAFRLEVVYRLQDDALSVETTTHNTGVEPLPYYPGHHFYFQLPHALRAETTLTLPPNRRQYHLPDGRLSVPERGEQHYRLNDPRLDDGIHLLDVSSSATLTTPSLGREISFDLRHGGTPWFALVTWTERADADFYCVEPWLGVPDAIHHGNGLRWLAPGASETALCRIGVRFDRERDITGSPGSAMDATHFGLTRTGRVTAMMGRQFPSMPS
ncbi:hypothetical protein PTE30175_05045 [Pandoraea terrae]|uniref:Aldose 1-epimerase n=1 Tax=Pandoraea terrae TaxID=1537710 RepID=A0A5E4Z778_9BURK|nr:aldose epimerase [Pandoraea terrae]VVE56924.1 hypothetical protein PTE30175_05045 [Pandoraea terrae]